MPLVQERFRFILLASLTCSLILHLACAQTIAATEANRALCDEYRQVVAEFEERNTVFTTGDVSYQSVQSVGLSVLIALEDFRDISLAKHSQADARLLDSLEGFQDLLLARLLQNAESWVILEDIFVADMTAEDRTLFDYEQPEYGKSVPELCRSAGLPAPSGILE